MSGEMSMQFDTIQMGIDDTRTCHNALVQEKEGLESFLRNLGAEWYGGASSQWQGTQQRWNQSCDGVNEILFQLIVALEKVHHTGKLTEHKLEQVWS